MKAEVNREAVLSAAFLDSLIKRSPEAEDILQDCGRLRLQRAALAAVELYLEMSALQRTEEVKE